MKSNVKVETNRNNPYIYDSEKIKFRELMFSTHNVEEQLIIVIIFFKMKNKSYYRYTVCLFSNSVIFSRTQFHLLYDENQNSIDYVDISDRVKRY